MDKLTLKLNGNLTNIPKNLVGQSFDYVSRHTIVAEMINEYFGVGSKIKVLDVGGLGSPLSIILGYDVTTVDEEAVNDKNILRADGASLPFKDNEFSCVVTCDTLEHVPEDDRTNFISELCRVSNDLVIICAPFNTMQNKKAEDAVHEFYMSFTGQEHRWLKEHKAYGLPNLAATISVLDTQIKNVDTVSHTNIDIWTSLMSANLLSNEMGFPDVERALSKANIVYAQSLFSDFDKEGYRTFIVGSHNKSIKIDKPFKIDNLNNEIDNLIASFYQECVSNAEYIPMIRTRIKTLHDETINLAKMVEIEKDKSSIH